MCEQTEINYLDGDVVWVKLRSFWWPGQVVCLEKLPEDVQVELQKKPLIAAVKFFQEDSFEFVKNYQQIYKYNCTQKEEFIRKGLDKYRSKSKDGSNYMDKFPEDVKTAEMLTNGDLDILSSEKFSPEEKPDISGLFGEKKIPKKKRNRDDLVKKSDNDSRRRVTHPRFLQENDHEIRIRQQPNNRPSASSSSSQAGIYSCYICGFTTTRVNVVICHLKNHRQNNETAENIKLKVKSILQSKPKQTNADSPKRKYVRKSVPGKSKNESVVEFGKRKHVKQTEKINKKKKSDPELREKLLADWNEDSDEDDESDFVKTVDVSSMDMSSKNQSSIESPEDTEILKDESSKDNMDSDDLLHESDKLLQETDSFTKPSILNDTPGTLGKEQDESNTEKSFFLSSPERSKESFHFKKTNVDKSFTKEKDDKKSRLSCFDFEEEDVPEPNISSVRKIPRSLGNKNISIKKEIIKEFEMSQALKNDAEKDLKSDDKLNTKVEEIQINKDDKNVKSIDNDENDKINTDQSDKKFDKPVEICETHVEIVEIFEVEKDDETKDVKKDEYGGVKKDNCEGIDKDVDKQLSKFQMEIEESAKSKFEIIAVTKAKLKDDDGNEINYVKNEVTNEEKLDKIKNSVKEDLAQDVKNDHSLKEDNENKEITFPKKELTNINLPNFTKDNSGVSNLSTLETEQSFVTLENQETTSENLTAQVEDNIASSADLIYETQNNSDLDDSLNFKSAQTIVPKDGDKSDVNEDNLNSIVKKRRGRPRKNVSSTEDVVSDNEHLKSEDFKKNTDVFESDRKTSESDSDRSYSGRKRKPNRKYQSSLYLQSFENRSSRTDESLSESDDKPELLKSKTKRGKRLTNNKSDAQLTDSSTNLESPINCTDDLSNMDAGTIEDTVKNVFNDKDLMKESDGASDIKDTSNQSNYNNLKEQKKIIKDEVTEDRQNNDVELLPPKKSQIKKFELSQIESSENDIKNANVNLMDHLSIIADETKLDVKEELVVETIQIQNEILKVPETTQELHILDAKTSNDQILENHKEDSVKVIVEEESSTIKSTLSTEKSTSLYKIDNAEKYVSVVAPKIKKEKLDDNQFDSFQDAFIKTLHTENPSKAENSDEVQKFEKKNVESKNKNQAATIEATVNKSLSQEPVMTNFSIMDNFDSIEVVVADNVEVEVKSEEVSFATNKNVIESTNDSTLKIQSSNISVATESLGSKSNESLKKLDVPSSSIPSSPSTVDIKVSVPVKKREKPRIIENVALKEPMILKTKLMEKHTTKIGKHKLESENLKSSESKSFPKTKVMKMETVITNSKNRLPIISSNQNLTVSKKVTKTLKAEDSSLISPTTDIKSEQIIAAFPQTISEVPCNEKYIQQSSQSLVDMELDINSMPFVLSEDVLTPESIEQMPVVISSVLPASNPITTTLSTTIPTTLITPTKQIISPSQLCEPPQEMSEITSKKKSGTPTILKSKSKAKPTITSIKTIVPPLASATYKGGYKVNTQALKTSLGNQKTPGKYVIVQTSGHQQAYSTHQKVAIPTSKGSGNAQIVQQGSKVVILTSPQSGQSAGQKVVPLNTISKSFNPGKVQRIITSKGQQVLTSVSPQSFVSSKTILSSKCGDLISSPTTSKMIGQKILGQQQMVTSKSVLTQLPGTISKSAVLGTIPQGILTKEGIFTPINASTLGGKTIISSKTLLTKGFPQSIAASKNTLTPISQSLSGKTIISSQGIISKGTVLTPITGSQVKALAAKNIKGNKMQYQTVHRKVQLTGTQKSPKVPISPSPVRSGVNLKTSSNVVVMQNTELKTIAPNKKCVKQVVQKSPPTTTVLSPTAAITMQQKGKAASTSVEQKVASSKNVNRSIKLQQKVISEKADVNAPFKPLITNETLALKSKAIEPQKQIVTTPVTKSTKGANKNLQKRISNTTNTVVLSPSNLSASLPISIPPLEPISHEPIPKKEETREQVIFKEENISSISQRVAVSEIEKIEEVKAATQPQIMALLTENSDGTQTYVLVTIDEQGHIVPLDNNALMSLDGTSNVDGSRTVYIDSSSLNESGNMENIVLQIDNSSLSNLQPATAPGPTPAVVTETLPTSEIAQSTNQDILAAALANTDFQHEIGVTETTGSTAISSLTQTNLINQTILQSTIIPPTEPISSPLVLETSLTLNQPIMTPLEVPSSLSIQSELTPITCTTTIPTSVELPISMANQNISYITSNESLQMAGNSMPEIGETMDTSSIEKIIDIKGPPNSECTIEANLVGNINNQPSDTESKADISYSISIPENDFDKKQIQTTPSMPIIDDTFNASNGFDSTNASVIVEDNLKNFVTKTSEELIQDLTGNDSSQENSDMLCSENVLHDKTCSSIQDVTSETAQIILSDTQDDCISSQESIPSIVEQSRDKIVTESIKCSSEDNRETLNTGIENSEERCTVSSESRIEAQSSQEVQKLITADKPDETELIVAERTLVQKEKPLVSNQETMSSTYQSDGPSLLNEPLEVEMVIDRENEEKPMEAVEEEVVMCQTSDPSPQNESNEILANECKLIFEDRITETSQEVPSQSYEQLVSATSDATEVPSQSAKSENSREATQSLSYEPMEINDNAVTGEPPTQSYEDSKQNEASQSYKILNEISANAPTQSFNEMMEVNEERASMDESIDDPNFPTQSYEVEKTENLVENMETDTEISQEGNIPSQSNDIGADGIGTSSVSTNNSGLNEDETASSSYVPETPENQERDQDQESAISTSSYEIPPCEELNIASSSVIPDTSVQSEHSSIHNNGVPEIPTSSYNLNPDSSSTHVDAVPTSSYEDQIVVEQNVSTSYQVPISMTNLEDTGSQNYVTDSSDDRNEPTSYYPHHQEVTESYYESMCKQSNSRLEANSEEEATPSYYESNPADVTSEASQSYFNQEEATPSYSSHDISPSYYDPRTEAEASQSYYSSHELSRSNQSALQNVEATQSFYQENSDEQRLRQQGEATPTYTDRYSVDYVPVSSPLDRHDLVESSVPGRSMDR